MSDMTFRKACAIITDASRDAKGMFAYAHGYARAGETMDEGSRESKIQALYILNNIGTWRGEQAKEVRNFLKAYAKDM